MLKHNQDLKKKIKSLSKQISKLPNGNFYCTHYKDYSKWYVSDGKSSTYIPKKKRKYAEQLAKKKYLQALKEDLKNESKAIEYYLHYYKNNIGKAEELFSDPAYQELLSSEFQPLSEELSTWQNEKFESCQYHPENLIHRTASGRFVRSKSEAIIDMFLSLNKIPFRYEEKLVLGKIAMYPDFTIRHPKTGEIFYWEHFGMMENPEYVQDAVKKIRRYSINGIILGINLIITCETDRDPLSTEMVQKIIEYYFCDDI